MSLREHLRNEWGITRSTVALFVGLVAFALTIAVVLFVAQGAFGPAGSAEGKVPYAAFSFSTSNVTVHGQNGTTNLTAVTIEYKSGTELPQRNVTVRINGHPAWNLVETADGQVTTAPWAASDLPISATSTRVVVYGPGSANESVTTWGANETYRPIESGDIVDVVWHGGEGQMTVLQRHVVDDGADENGSGNESG